MKNYIRWSCVIAACTIALFLAGCASGTKVTTTQEKYVPSFKSGDFSRYKGKKVILANFANQAQNTKTYSYFSPDKKLTYEFNVSLEQFYWNCFQKAFRHIGVTQTDYVYDEEYNRRYGYRHGWWWGAPGPGGYRAPKGASEFQLYLLSITDQEFRFKVMVVRDGASKFDKEYTVTMAAATTESPSDLEKRAYQMVDLSFTTIMRDKEFQKVF